MNHLHTSVFPTHPESIEDWSIEIVMQDAHGYKTTYTKDGFANNVEAYKAAVEKLKDLTKKEPTKWDFEIEVK